MKLIGKSSYTGSDTLKFYDLGDNEVGIVHVQEWEDFDSSAVETHGKYNAIAHHVCVSGFDAYGQPEGHIGQSVHDSLRSCGFELSKSVISGELIISNSYDGAVLAHGTLADVRVKLVIAEAMYGYGAGDRVSDESGNNARKLEKEARRAL